MLRKKEIIYLQINGTLAQLVEQRTENPCVPGSIPGGTTLKPCNQLIIRVLIYLFHGTADLLEFQKVFISQYIQLQKTGILTTYLMFKVNLL